MNMNDIPESVVRDAIYDAIRDSLESGNALGFGERLVCVFEGAVSRTMEECFGSREFGDIVSKAIVEGIENRRHH